MATTDERAATLLAELDRNVEAMIHDKITHEEFGRLQRLAWDRVEAAGVRAQVDAELRRRVTDLWPGSLRMP